ncbi:hypothetical protein HYH02_012264 [Chlamydomonas schloesseri]|uniref:EF-hand domain-containing protein n=1 Tax=Chlamydomonas schloesseri TaxID=2026947 RepID=A0A835T5X2_9CHLO|nr:hypothetical protein HYH02_012264 [Chlamydomonas schloesseri]|eukprot:KAG2434434.1 hypothetical protein HYH02_012264 [Chlamydomonas schloesseri]
MAAASTSGRQASEAPGTGPPPFSHSRLRSYASKVEGLLDPKMVVSSSVALASSGLADPFPASPSGQQLTPKSARFAGAGGGGTNGIAAARTGGHAQSAVTTAGANGQGPQVQPPQQPASAEELAAALNQIQTLKAEIAGVETVLGYLKSSEAATTTMGRKAHKLPSQEQLRQRADALSVSRAAAARASLDATGGHHLSPLRASQGHGLAAAGAGGSGSGGPSSGYGSPAAGGSPARARSAGDAAGAGAGAGTGGLFESLAAETRLGRTWRAPKAPQPVGRGEAVILEGALDEALPPGSITAKYGTGAGAGVTGGLEPSFWSGGEARRDFDMLDMVQREVARQVAASCSERGRIIDKLADRHAELYGAVAAAARSATEAQRGLSERLAAVTARASEQVPRGAGLATEIARLRSELATKGAEAEDLRQQLAETSTQHEHYVWDSEQELETLQGQSDILAAEVEHLHVRLAEAVADKDAALSRGLARLEGDLAAVTDERDDLSQRIRFLERQLHKLRTEMNSTVVTAVAEVQTDPVNWATEEPEDVPDDVSDTPSLAEIRARYAAHGYGALTPEERLRLGLPAHMDGEGGGKTGKGKKRKRALGHFQGLISSEKPGRVRGLQWTVNAIATMYYDKMKADARSDLEGNPRQRLADFAVDWHMTRFGLRNLAELNLLDLIASVRQHYKTAVRVRWFGQFTGLVEVGDQVDTTPHVSFYLHTLACLAAPNSLVSLFPDTAASGGAGSEEAGGGTPPVAIKAAVLPEAIKAIYRYLNEPESATGFLARACDPLTDPDSVTVPLDPLVALLMAEYQKRWERNAAHLRALFRAGDYDGDGLIGYDEFVAVVRQLLPDSGDRTFTKMYGEAMRRLAAGQSLLDVDTFLAVARTFGCDRWRIDAGPTASAYGGSSSGGFPGPYTNAPSPSGAAAALGGGSGPSRSGSVLGSAPSMGVLRARSTSTASNLRRTESVVGLADSDRALMRVLDGAVDGLEPPLEEQLEGLLAKLRTSAAATAQHAEALTAATATLPGIELGSGTNAKELAAAAAEDNAMIAKLEAQAAHFQAVYQDRTDPAAAWLAFRMLLASLAAAAGGARVKPNPSNARSRPGSGKSQAGGDRHWVGAKALARLTVPAVPFRAGSSAAASRPGTNGSLQGSPSLGRVLGSGGEGSYGPSSPAAYGSGGGAGGGGGGGGGGVGAALRPRSAATRSPELPHRQVALTQMMQNVGGLGGGSGSFSAGDRRSLVQPPPSGGNPLPMHRTPLPATTSGRVSNGAGSAGGVGVSGLGSPPPASPGSPHKRGVVFSMSQLAASPAAVAAAAANAASFAAAQAAAVQAAAGAGGQGGGYAGSMDGPELSVGRFEAL